MDQYYKEFNEYYEYKKKYTAKIEKIIQSIKEMVDMSVAEKRTRFKEYTPKCVNCNNSGGTYFIESSTNLKAHCLANPPCDFNKNISKKSVKRLDSAYNTANTKIKEIKMKLITTQLNYMFGFDTKDETVIKSSELKLELKPEEKEFNKINSLIQSHIIDNSIIENIQMDIFKATDDLKNKMDKRDNLNTETQRIDEVPYDEIKDKYAEINKLYERYRKTKYQYYKLEKNKYKGENIEGVDEENEKKTPSVFVYNLVVKPYLYSQMEYEENH